MTMTDPLGDPLSELMRSSVADAPLDMERLLAGSLRDGTRIRRRRRAAVVGAGLAVAGIAAATTVGVLAGSGEGARATDPAGAPAANPPARTAEQRGLNAGDTFDFGAGVTGTIVSCTTGPDDPDTGMATCILPSSYAIEMVSTRRGSGEGFAVVITGPAQAVNDFWSAGFDDPRLTRHRGLTYAIDADSPLIAPINQGQRVSIDVPGWTLDPAIVDDKQSLTGPDGAVADIVWRRAADHAGWTAGDDKADGAFVSEVHDGVFVTIQGGQGTTQADLDALGASLTWR